MSQLLYDAIRGIDGKPEPKTTALRQDILAGFVCDGYNYTMDIIQSAPPYVSDYYAVVLAYDLHSQESHCNIYTICESLRWARWGEGGLQVQFLILGVDTHIHMGDWSRSTNYRDFQRDEGGFLPKLGCGQFAKCSARTGEGVHQALGLLVQHTHAQRMRFEGNPEGLRHNKDLARKVFQRVLGGRYIDRRGQVRFTFATGAPSTR